MGAHRRHAAVGSGGARPISARRAVADGIRTRRGRRGRRHELARGHGLRAAEAAGALTDMLSRMQRIAIFARLEWHDSLRSRWLQFVACVYVLVFGAFIW